MSLEQPSYWLAYLSDAERVRNDEVTAIAPEVLSRSALGSDAQTLLAAADAYHDRHPRERVVFAAAVTRWLHVEYGARWADIDVDFYEALFDFDAHAPALLIEASSTARAIVADASLSLQVLAATDEERDPELPVEPVRAALIKALVRDWPSYIRSVVDHQRSRGRAGLS